VTAASAGGGGVRRRVFKALTSLARLILILGTPSPPRPACQLLQQRLTAVEHTVPAARIIMDRL